MSSLNFTNGIENTQSITLKYSPNCCEGKRTFKLSNHKEYFYITIKYTNPFSSKVIEIGEDDFVPANIKEMDVFVHYNGKRLTTCEKKINLIVFEQKYCTNIPEANTHNIGVNFQTGRTEFEIDSLYVTEEGDFKISFPKTPYIISYDIAMTTQDGETLYQRNIKDKTSCLIEHTINNKDLPYSEEPLNVEISYVNFKLEEIKNKRETKIYNLGNLYNGQEFNMEIRPVSAQKINDKYKYVITSDSGFEGEFILWLKEDKYWRPVEYKLEGNELHFIEKRLYDAIIYLEKVSYTDYEWPYYQNINTNTIEINLYELEIKECASINDIILECRGKDYLLFSYTNESENKRIAVRYWEKGKKEMAVIKYAFDKRYKNECIKNDSDRYFFMIYSNPENQQENLKQGTTYEVQAKVDKKMDCDYGEIFEGTTKE